MTQAVLAQLHLRLSETLQGDRADGRERSVLHRHAIGDGHRQILRDAIELGVIGVADAGASDPLPDEKRLGVRAQRDDFARPGIAERRQRVELVHDLR